MFLPPPARSQYSILVRDRVRFRVRRRLRVGAGIRVKVGSKDSVGVLHRLGGEGCYMGKRKNLRAPLAPPYVWPVAIDPW